MELEPRYDGPPILRYREPTEDISVPLLRQRRRLAETLRGLDDDQWAAPSRCEEWAVRDVLAHLVGVDQFWTVSTSCALDGRPTRFLAGFDPVATPTQMVEATRMQTTDELLAAFETGIDGLGDLVQDLDPQQWSLPAEAPPGLIPLHGLAQHALWDAWIHERDILVPLGIEPTLEPDELAPALTYAAALTAMFSIETGPDPRRGILAVSGQDPDCRLVLEVDETVTVSAGSAPARSTTISGPTVELIEGLSFRGPMSAAVDGPDQWILAGLARVFEA